MAVMNECGGPWQEHCKLTPPAVKVWKLTLTVEVWSDRDQQMCQAVYAVPASCCEGWCGLQWLQGAFLVCKIALSTVSAVLDRS